MRKYFNSRLIIIDFSSDTLWNCNIFPNLIKTINSYIASIFRNNKLEVDMSKNLSRVFVSIEINTVQSVKCHRINEEYVNYELPLISSET